MMECGLHRPRRIRNQAPGRHADSLPAEPRIASGPSVRYTMPSVSSPGLNQTGRHPFRGLRVAWRAVVVAVLLADPLPLRAETNLFADIRGLVVDGQRITPKPGDKLRLDRQPRTVVFEVGPSTNRSRPPARFRFKLDGYEEPWRESQTDMRLYLRFLDDRGDQVGEARFTVSGQSEGWTGDPRTAAFTHRRETTVVPPNATSYWVVLTSAGPPAALGTYAIADLVIRSASPDATADAVSLRAAFAEAGGQAGGSAPVGWMRDGLRPSMAKVFETTSPRPRQGLVIVDDDLSGHAEWHTLKEFAVRVTPGEQLALEWDEAYSIGLAGAVAVQYVDLPAGYYRFRLNEVSVTGEPTAWETSLGFAVPLAFWRTPWFWIAMGSLALAAVAGVWRYTVWQRLQRELLRFEQQRAVDRERLRIAQDIHDDLGARVTQISLLSAVAQGKPSLPETAREDFGQITQTTRELVSALYETVWAVNPENDNMDALASYLCQMANQLCAQAGLRCRLELPEVFPQVTLSSHARHNLIMAVKEALHNVIKHARASEARIRITFIGFVLRVCVQDDGRGFDAATCPPGNGLANLKRRLEGIGGSHTVESRLGVGTTVTLTLPIAEVTPSA